jgi:AhpD family alkylhydroperoxidase
MVLRDVEWEACVLEPRPDPELESYVRRQLGVVPSSIPYFTLSPWIVRSMAGMSYAGSPLVHLSYFVADLVQLVVSQDNSCRYCFGIQRTVMRVHGMPERRIREIEQNFLEAEIDPPVKSALDFARRISRAAPTVQVSDTAALSAAGWTGDAIKELAFQAAFGVYMNRLMTEPAIPVARPERMSEHWALGLVAPVVRLVMRRRWKRGHGTPLSPAEGRGPWSYVVRSLDGLPCARALRATLDGAWESPVLSQRGKALIFAAVARGLDCAAGVREANGLLEQTGLSPGQIEEILAHLGSPELDPVENALVAFARGTIRGRPAQLQQRTRALHEHLRPEQVVEAIGVSALANAVCRLGVVTQLG